MLIYYNVVYGPIIWSLEYLCYKKNENCLVDAIKLLPSINTTIR